MKLNKKGFAFSTMLYGSVALIAVVLYLVLNINKTSRDTTYYYGEEVLKDLNDCVTEEIALENCYSSGNPNCDATAYHACLGVSDSHAVEKGMIISEKLKENLKTNEDGLQVDPYNQNRYIYVGDSVNNYIEFSGKIWRIISIEKNGAISLLDINKYITTSWDSTNNRDWENSTLFSTLNNSYLSSISDSSKLSQRDWFVPYIYPSSGNANKLTLDELILQEEINQDGYIAYSKYVGIVSVGDLMKATNNANCKSDVLNSSACNSWLSAYKGWTIDVNGEIDKDPSETSDLKSYYAYYLDTGNKISMGKTDTSHDVYPVILLDRNCVIAGGIGTLGNPYVLK